MLCLISFISPCFILPLEPTPLLFCQPHFPDESPHPSPYVISSFWPSPVLLSITPSLFHSKLKTYLFIYLFRLSLFLYPMDWFHGFLDLALIGLIFFLVSLFVNFLLWPRAVNCGYSSVFDCMLNNDNKHYRIVSPKTAVNENNFSWHFFAA